MRIALILAALTSTSPLLASQIDFDRGFSMPVVLSSIGLATPHEALPAAAPTLQVQEAEPAQAASFSAPTVAPEDRAEFELGVLAGLSGAVAGLSAREAPIDSLEVIVRVFVMQRNAGNSTASALNEIAKQLDDRYARMVIDEAAADLFSAPQRGEGNVYYWKNVLAQQNAAFDRVAQRLDRLRESQLAKGARGAPFDSGLLVGLLAVEGPLSMGIRGAGNVYYWQATFRARRAFGNAVAGVLRALSPDVSQRRLGTELAQLCGDLLGVSERPDGDVYHWLQMTKEQEQVFTRVAERIAMLRQLVGAPAA